MKTGIVGSASAPAGSDASKRLGAQAMARLVKKAALKRNQALVNLTVERGQAPGRLEVVTIRADIIEFWSKRTPPGTVPVYEEPPAPVEEEPAAAPAPARLRKGVASKDSAVASGTEGAPTASKPAPTAGTKEKGAPAGTKEKPAPASASKDKADATPIVASRDKEKNASSKDKADPTPTVASKDKVPAAAASKDKADPTKDKASGTPAATKEKAATTADAASPAPQAKEPAAAAPTPASTSSSGPPAKPAKPIKRLPEPDAHPDFATNLTWQRRSPKEKYTWKDAQTYCASLGTGGWRLPNKDELLTLLEKRFKGAMEQGSEDEEPSGSYWSANVASAEEDTVWAVNFTTGEPSDEIAERHFRVRCVK